MYETIDFHLSRDFLVLDCTFYQGHSIGHVLGVEMGALLGHLIDLRHSG
jgi:hypothetical protein